MLDPDAAGLEGADRALKLADDAGKNDLVLVLMSGGASANLVAPAQGIWFEDKQAVTRALLRSGATINEINVVRKHLSRIKGGRLAAHAHPAKLVTIAISDVPGDDPSAIGSGPTVPDPTTLRDARAIVAKYKLEFPEAITRALDDQRNKIAKAGDPVFAGSEVMLAARPADAMRAPRLPFALPVTSVFSSVTASRAKRARSPSIMRASCANCAQAGGAP